MSEHDLVTELSRLGYDASGAGAVSAEGKMLLNVNGHLMTFDEARALTKGDTLENVVKRIYDKMHPPK
ncbi:hypothetical protein SBA4_3230017 [Candidatus Sulfopaludibacter sp. SbA4]|nr:hypothetical protein SBA4_3230017 [Candidatus Sulfopaludibacter sp. SbA4]